LEAITSRPLLLTAVGNAAIRANQIKLYPAPLDAELTSCAI